MNWDNAQSWNSPGTYISWYDLFIVQLDKTEDVEERRELRKRIREIRNKKFEEELKKISGGEKSSSSLVSDLSQRTTKPTRVPTIDQEGDDPYGLLHYTDEAALQDLVRTFLKGLITPNLKKQVH